MAAVIHLLIDVGKDNSISVTTVSVVYAPNSLVNELFPNSSKTRTVAFFNPSVHGVSREGVESSYHACTSLFLMAIKISSEAKLAQRAVTLMVV